MVRASVAAVLALATVAALGACGDDSGGTGGSSNAGTGATTSSSGSAGPGGTTTGAGGGGGQAATPCEPQGNAVGTWSPVSTEGAPTANATAILWNGDSVIIVDTANGVVHAYDPAADVWLDDAPLPPLVTGRSHAYVAWFAGGLFVWGGQDSDGVRLATGVLVDLESGDFQEVATAGAPDLDGSLFARGGPSLVSPTSAAITLFAEGADGAHLAGTYQVDQAAWRDLVPIDAGPPLYDCETFAFDPSSERIACGGIGDPLLFGIAPFQEVDLPEVPGTDSLSRYSLGWQGERIVAYARISDQPGALVSLTPGDAEWAVLGSHPDRVDPAYGMVDDSFVVWGGYDDAKRSDGVVVPAEGPPVPTTCTGAPLASTRFSVSIGDGLFVFDPLAGVGGIFRL